MEAKTLLQQYGVRATRSREMLAEAILALKKRHFSVEDIMRFLAAAKKKVSRATIFRTINVYVKKNMLTTIDLGRDYRIYELARYNSRHHDHLYCMRCGRVIEFEQANIEKLQDEVCRRKKFKPFNHTLRIVGVCSSCRK